MIHPNNFINVPWTEHVPGSPQESFDYDSGQATRIFDVAWGDRISFINNMLGYVDHQISQKNPPFGYLKRFLPYPYAEKKLLYASKVSIEGLCVPSELSPGTKEDPTIENPNYNTQTGEPIAAYKIARITVTFNTLPYDVFDENQTYIETVAKGDTKRFIIKHHKPTVEFLTMPGTNFEWDGAGNPAAGTTLQSDVTISIVEADVDWTWVQIPEFGVPLAIISLFLGTVNELLFPGDPVLKPSGSTGEFQYATEKLLLLAVDIVPGRAPFGNRTWTINYKLKYRSFGNNSVYNPGSGTYRRVRRHNNITKSIYELNLFEYLFIPDSPS